MFESGPIDAGVCKRGGRDQVKAVNAETPNNRYLAYAKHDSSSSGPKKQQIVCEYWSVGGERKRRRVGSKQVIQFEQPLSGFTNSRRRQVATASQRRMLGKEGFRAPLWWETSD